MNRKNRGLSPIALSLVQNTTYGGAGNDLLLGGREFDRLYGGSGDDAIFGGGGADLIYAGAGDDSVIGNSGGDVIIGGLGPDTLAGESIYETEPGLHYEDYLDVGIGAINDFEWRNAA